MAIELNKEECDLLLVGLDALWDCMTSLPSPKRKKLEDDLRKKIQEERDAKQVQ